MITHVSQYPEKVIPAGGLTVSTPSCFIEYGYYVFMLYMVMGTAWGLTVTKVGGLILAVLFGWCLLTLGSRVRTVIGLVVFPLGCGISYVFIQLVLHQESLMDGSVRDFVLWTIQLVVVQSLALRRNFLHRFALVTLFCGLAFLPYVNILQEGDIQRIELERVVGYAGSNDLAKWYGFCAVYFTVLGNTTRRNAVRILSWLIVAACLFMLTLTVSRGALLAAAIAIVVASRHLLKRGFLAILLLICMSWIIVDLGVFDQAIRAYDYRGMEETGRGLVWPLVVERFLDSPLIGVGASNAGAVVYTGRFITPHNVFLFLAVASGVIPCALFVAYWLRAARAALHANVKSSPDAAFHIPLLIYAVLAVSTSDMIFMAPWVMVSLAVVMTAGVRQRQPEAVPRQRSGAVGTPRFGIAK